MSIRERRHLEINLDKAHSNELPVTASAVGLDLNTGKQIYFNTGSLAWEIQTGFTGSVTKLTDGSDYLIASGAINLTTASNGAVKINVFEESGNYTPALSFSGGVTATYASQVGTYYKIGKQVTVNFALVLASLSAGPADIVSLINLPFTSQTSTDGAGGGAVPDYKNINNGNRVSSILIRVGSNTTTASLYHVTGQALNAGFLTYSNLTGTTQLSGSLYYIAAQ